MQTVKTTNELPGSVGDYSVYFLMLSWFLDLHDHQYDYFDFGYFASLYCTAF